MCGLHGNVGFQVEICQQLTYGICAPCHTHVLMFTYRVPLSGILLHGDCHCLASAEMFL